MLRVGFYDGAISRFVSVEETQKNSGGSMKAYNVYPGENPYESGCLLVYASSRNIGRSMAFRKGPWNEYDYIDFRAIRANRFDDLFRATGCYYIENNDELPDGVKFYVEDL
jgi:hypothetical protein